MRCREIDSRDAVDGLRSVARAHGLLTTYVEAEIGNRLRGHNPKLAESAREYHTDREQHGPRELAPDAIERVTRLLDPKISIDAAYREMNGARARPTPQVTIEAILHSVRSRGLTALEEPATQEPLARCDRDAHQQLAERIAGMLERGEI
jgi:hypothetical protein